MKRFVKEMKIVTVGGKYKYTLQINKHNIVKNDLPRNNNAAEITQDAKGRKK